MTAALVALPRAAPEGWARVSLAPNVFRPDLREDTLVEPGTTLAEALEAAGAPLIVARGIDETRRGRVLVELNGMPIPPERWTRLRLRDGDLISARIAPGYELLAILGSIAIAIAPYVPGATTIAGWLTAVGVPAGLSAAIGIGTSLAITFGISLAISALTSPPAQKSNRAGLKREDSPTLYGAQNELTPYRPNWRIFGRRRIRPPLGAHPFQEIVGDDVYLNLIFCPGIGPLEFSDHRIGETPLSSYDHVEIEIRQGFPGEPPLTLVTQAADTEELNVSLFTADKSKLSREKGRQFVRRTRPESDAFGVILVFQEGIGGLGAKGAPKTVTVGVRVEYSLVGSGTWTAADARGPLGPGITTGSFFGGSIFGVPLSYGAFGPTGLFSFSGREQGAKVRGIVVDLPVPGEYDVRVTAVDAAMEGVGNVLTTDAVGFWHACTWASLQSIRKRDPMLRANGRAKIAMRIKASDQLSGVISTYNVVAQALLPTADADGNLSLPVATRNPAWAFLEWLRGSGTKRKADPSRIDFPAIKAWADWCDANGRTYDEVVDYETTMREALENICRIARASFTLHDGKYSVIQDVPRSQRDGDITPGNSSGWQWKRSWIQIPHCLRVPFQNEAQDWKDDEALIYFPGYDANNATLFETQEFPGLTNFALIYRDVQFHFAVALNRGETHIVSQGFENLHCRRGDLVAFAHDGALIGLTYGRLTAVTVGGGGEITSVETTANLEFLPDGHGGYLRHGLVVRYADLSSHQTEVDVAASLAAQTAAGHARVAVLLVPFPAADPGPPVVLAPAVGDLFHFGELGRESLPCLVNRVTHDRDLAAKVELIPYAPEVYAADGLTIPIHDPRISRRPDQQPLAPLVLGVDLTDDGFLVVKFAVSPTDPVHIASVRGQWRVAAPIGEWRSANPVPPDAGQIRLGPATPGLWYDCRIGTISDRLMGSPLVGPSEPIFFSPGATVADFFAVSGLELEGGGSASEFEGSEPTIVWRLAMPGGIEGLFGQFKERVAAAARAPAYRVTVKDAITGAVRRTDVVSEPRYVYTAARQALDAAPVRALRFVVGFFDLDGNVGPETSFDVTNPAPAIPTDWLAGVGPGTLSVYVLEEPPSDLAGYVLAAHTSPGFDPVAYVKARSSGPTLTCSGLASGTWKWRVGILDTWAAFPVGVVWSAEQSIAVSTSGAERTVIDDGTVSDADDATHLTDDTKTWTVGQFAPNGLTYELELVDGRGRGRARKILDNTATRLTLDGALRARSQPEVGDAYRIVVNSLPFEVVNELRLQSDLGSQVDTDGIAEDAITTHVEAYTEGAYTVADDAAWHDIQAATVTVETTRGVELIAQFRQDTGGTLKIRITRDTAAISPEYWGPSGGNTGRYSYLDTGATTGDRDYAIQCKSIGGGAIDVSQRLLTVEETKR